MARLPGMRAIDAPKNPYCKGIKVLIPAQIVVNANGPELNDRKADDKKTAELE